MCTERCGLRYRHNTNNAPTRVVQVSRANQICPQLHVHMIAVCSRHHREACNEEKYEPWELGKQNSTAFATTRRGRVPTWYFVEGALEGWPLSVQGARCSLQGPCTTTVTVEAEANNSRAIVTVVVIAARVDFRWRQPKIRYPQTMSHVTRWWSFVGSLSSNSRTYSG